VLIVGAVPECTDSSRESVATGVGVAQPLTAETDYRLRLLQSAPPAQPIITIVPFMPAAAGLEGRTM